jgi:hypothetical protein
LEGAQQQGPVVARYGIAVGGHDPYALVDDLSLPLRVVVAPGGGERGATGSELDVKGAEVSALRRVGGSLEVRVFNPSDAATRVQLAGRSGWLVDLRGAPIEPFDGGFDLRPWGIATAVLR